MAKGSLTSTRSLTNYLFWTLILQGVSFIVLGILIVLYPAILFVLVAAAFIWMGFTTILLAWRVRSFWGFLPELF